MRLFTRNLDRVINSRKTQNIGIKMGIGLFITLIKAGKIKKTKFSVLGTRFLEGDFLAYNQKYAVWLDLELPNYSFIVGK